MTTKTDRLHIARINATSARQSLRGLAHDLTVELGGNHQAVQRVYDAILLINAMDTQVMLEQETRRPMRVGA